MVLIKFIEGLMPTVVPELKSITIGGAVVGVGVESSSFRSVSIASGCCRNRHCRYGFVHETILEMEVLLANGEVLICTPDNEHSDLFFAIPNSYGTFGYILRLKGECVGYYWTLISGSETYTGEKVCSSSTSSIQLDGTSI